MIANSRQSMMFMRNSGTMKGILVRKSLTVRRAAIV